MTRRPSAPNTRQTPGRGQSSGRKKSGKVVKSDDDGIQFMGENTSNPSKAVKAGNAPKARKQPGPSKTAANAPAPPAPDAPAQPAADAPAQPAAAPYLTLDSFAPP